METDFFDLTYASASTYHPHPCTTAQQPRRYNLRSTLSFYSGLRPLFTHIGCEIILSCWYPRSGGKGGQRDSYLTLKTSAQPIARTKIFFDLTYASKSSPREGIIHAPLDEELITYAQLCFFISASGRCSVCRYGDKSFGMVPPFRGKGGKQAFFSYFSLPHPLVLVLLVASPCL